MLDRRPRQHQGVAAEDVVDVGALLRQHVDLREVARGAREALVELRAVDDQHRAPAELLEALRELLGLAGLDRGALQHDQLALGLLRRERAQEAQAPDLLLQAEAVVARNGAEDHRAAAELRRAEAALAGAAGALLPPGLLGGALDIRDALGLVRPGAALGELPIDDASQDVAPHRRAEHLVGKLDAADFLGFEIANGNLHLTRSPSRRAPLPPPPWP